MTHIQLEAYGRKWQRRLALGQWQIAWELVAGKQVTPDGSTGEVIWTLDALKATIRVATIQEPEAILNTARHELLHLACADIDAHAENIITRLDSAAARGIATAAMDNAQEQFILRVERALTELIDHGD